MKRTDKHNGSSAFISVYVTTMNITKKLCLTSQQHGSFSLVDTALVCTNFRKHKAFAELAQLIAKHPVKLTGYPRAIGEMRGCDSRCCRKATKKRSKSAFAVPAQELDKLLSELHTALDAADLPSKRQHWVMFSVLEAYLCQRQCYAALHDASQFQQVRLSHH